METLRSVVSSLVPPLWASTIDLKDTYLHILICPRDFRFLCFSYNGLLFEFTALPFCLSTLPRVFTHVVKMITAFIRLRDVLIFQYLNAWLIVGRS